MTVEQARYDFWLASSRMALLTREGWGDTPHFSRVNLWAEAKALAYDLAVSARHMNRLGSAPTIPVWMLPVPEQEARNARAGNARRALTGSAPVVPMPPGRLGGSTARTTTDRTALGR